MRSAFTGFVGALAVVALAVMVALSVASLLQFAATPGPDRIAVIAVVVLAALVLPHPEDGAWRIGAWAGVGLGTVGAFAADAFGSGLSIGAGQLGAVAGAVLAIPVLQRMWSADGAAPSALPGWLIAALFALVAVGLVRTILDGGGFGHDESAYALKARTWLQGTPDTGWQLHRAPLNSVLGVPVVAVTENEVPFRLIGAVLGLVALSGVGFVAKRLGGVWSAVIAIATVGASLSFLRRSSEYLTDVSAAGLLLLIVWLVLTIVSEPTTWRRRVLWLAPLVLAAFYMRYQSALGVVAVAVGAVLVWPRVILLLRRELAIAVGLVAIGLVPHLVWATVVTGTPWGVVTLTQGAAGRAFVGEGVIDYLRFFPVDLAGPLGALVMVLGLVWLGTRIGRSVVGVGRDSETDLAWFVVVVAFVSVVPLGLVAHGEPRFVFFAVWLLIAVGSAFGVRLLGRLPRRLALVTVAVAVILWLPLFTETVRLADRNAETRGKTFAVVVDASNAVEIESGGDCGVMTTYEPQVNWYSKCWTERFYPNDEDLGVGRLEGRYRYAMIFENGKRQPQGEALDEYLELGPSEIVPAENDRIGDATVVEVS